MSSKPFPDGTEATNGPIVRSDTIATIPDDDMEQATQSLLSLAIELPGAWPKPKKIKPAKRARSIRATTQRSATFRKQNYNLRSVTGT